MKRPYFAILFILIVGLALVAYFWPDGNPQVKATLVAATPDISNFARVEGPRPFDFSVDHGPHPDYQTEWWYYTGNLDTTSGEHFGFQLTFFRRALVPAADLPGKRASSWAFDQVYLGHFALTDVAGEAFYAFEQLSRGAAGLAGAQAQPFQVWLENWSVRQGGPGIYQLSAEDGAVSLNLTLEDVKGPILHGNGGYSQKGPEPGNASFYVSQPRLAAKGSVSTPQGQFEVTGTAWMDQEYSTSALSEGQVGWDWFSIQLDDDTELMLFQIRRDDGSVDPFSSGTVIYPDGTTRHISLGDFTITVNDTWRSPHTGGVYPSDWTIDLPGEKLLLTLTPRLADQELQLSYNYWEGSVAIRGERDGQPVSGNGYVELTGYAGAFNLDF